MDRKMIPIKCSLTFITPDYCFRYSNSLNNIKNKFGLLTSAQTTNSLLIQEYNPRIDKRDILKELNTEEEESEDDLEYSSDDQILPQTKRQKKK